MIADRRQAALEHYEEMARLGHALGSPVRLRLLDLLRQAPRSVDALAEQAGLPVANVSQHLRHLRAAHVVASKRDGQRVVYRVADPKVSSFFVAFRSFSELLLPELQPLRSTANAHEPGMAPSEARQMQQNGQAVLVDVRPGAEFKHAHAEGAMSIPLHELPSRLHELPNDKVVVTTCRGPYCPLAIEAVLLLRAAGYDAAHVDLDTDESAPAEHLRALTSETPESHRNNGGTLKTRKQ